MNYTQQYAVQENHLMNCVLQFGLYIANTPTNYAFNTHNFPTSHLSSNHPHLLTNRHSALLHQNLHSRELRSKYLHAKPPFQHFCPPKTSLRRTKTMGFAMQNAPFCLPKARVLPTKMLHIASQNHGFCTGKSTLARNRIVQIID